MYPLLICSVLLIATVAFRILNVRRSMIAPGALVDKLESCLKGDISIDDLGQSVQQGRTPLSRLIAGVVEDNIDDEETLRKLVEVRAKEEFTELQAGLPLIDIIVMVSPMFGILGTAWGLVLVFASFGLDGSEGGIAQGISNALNTTIAGLAIATPAVIANTCFSRQLERISAQMELLLSELISLRFRSISKKQKNS